MELATVVSLITLVSGSMKLLSGGLKLMIWEGWHELPGRDRVAWVAKLLELNKDIVAPIGELLKEGSGFAKDMQPDLVTQLWAVHVACIGEALISHWGGSQRMAGQSESEWRRKMAPSWVKERVQEFEAALTLALTRLEVRKSQKTISRTDWHIRPTDGQMYRTLWEALTDAEATATGPLLSLDSPGVVQAFEQAFAQAFREALARRGNADLRLLLTQAESAGEDLRRLLAAEMAGWRHRHVFAGVDTESGIPEMPLERIYVEPSAVVGENRGPALKLIREMTSQHKIIFVSADFGHGKSLTARTLAWQWAVEYLAPTTTPSADRIFPIYVRCHSDFRAGADFETAARRALKRGAEAVGVAVKPKDEALSPPPDSQRTVYLLDGLDEVLMNAGQAKHFLDALEDHATKNHRFIVFSRPEALAQERTGTERASVPHIEIQKFAPEQTQEWLWAWSGHQAPSWEDFEKYKLTELAAVPILLFMLALSWPEFRTKAESAPRVHIYDTFFKVLAAGKYELGGETHPQVQEAANSIREVLVTRGELKPWTNSEGKERAVEAMQWLMDRIAWEAMRREFSHKGLSRRDVENILANELGLPDTTLEQVRIGVLLGMQAQVDGGSVQQFFFGHRSFLEFSVARYWERQITRVANADYPKIEKIERELMGAPLISFESKTWEMLCEWMNGWGKEMLERAFTWAQRVAKDASIDPMIAGERPSFLGDGRVLLRQAALAIGGWVCLRLDDERMLDLGNAATLLEISAWWRISRKRHTSLIAPCCRIDSGSTLIDGSFVHCDLRHACLSGVNLQTLSFSMTNMEHCNLEGATCEGVMFIRSNMSFGRLSRARFIGSFMHATNLSHAMADGTTFAHSHLTEVNLESASLVGANMRLAILNGANLSSADLRGCHLEGADLENSILQNTKLEGAFYDSSTKFPADFLPSEYSMIFVPDKGEVEVEV